jgi:pimeloyl-ACP methyl ester carboxylesterase
MSNYAHHQGPCSALGEVHLHALAEAGFHAIAPDMRGYGQTDRPERLDGYTLLHHVVPET